MITMELDGALCYAPHIQDNAYALRDLKLTGEVNKADTLTCVLPACNRAYGTARPLKSSVILRDGGEILFFGRVLSIERDFYSNQSLTCEGALAWLNDSIIPPHTYNGAVSGYVEYVLGLHSGQVEADRQIVLGHLSDVNEEDIDDSTITGYTINGTFYTIDEIARQVIRGQWGNGSTRRRRLEAAGCSYEIIQNRVAKLMGYRPPYDTGNTSGASGETTIDVEVKDYQTAWDCLTGDWLSDTGYTLSARAVEENGAVTVYLDLLSKNGSVGEQEIRFGRNLLDLEEYIDAAEIYTRVIPLGKNNLTISTVNSGAIFLENTTLSALYGQITKTVSHSDISNATKLKAAGQEDLKACLSAAISLTIKAVDLTITGDAEEAFYVGGWNRVCSPPHGYDEYLQCTRIVRNLQDPGRDEFTFGATRNGVSDTVAALAAGK